MALSNSFISILKFVDMRGSVVIRRRLDKKDLHSTVYTLHVKRICRQGSCSAPINHVGVYVNLPCVRALPIAMFERPAGYCSRKPFPIILHDMHPIFPPALLWGVGVVGILRFWVPIN